MHVFIPKLMISYAEVTNLTLCSVMQRAGMPMLYDSASNQRLPCLYICSGTSVLGRAPLIPCFVGGNIHPTIPHSFKDGQRLESASADTQRDWGNSCRLYEVNILDVALRQGQPPDGVHCGGWKNQERACRREQD
jgi:hypothetical protein